MNLSEYLINEIGESIIGDNGVGFPYLKGPEVMKLYNPYSQTKHIYPKDLEHPTDKYNRSRKQYSIDRLREVNSVGKAKELIEKIIDKAHFIKYNIGNDYDKVLDNFREIIKSEGYKIDFDSNGKARVEGGNMPDEPLSVEIHFKNIKEQIISKIREAKVTIWIAMAWFTDDDLLREIWKKEREGLDVKIIVFDDSINFNVGILKENRKEHFKQLRKTSYKDDRIKMHNKFCVIDTRIVLHGTFNYSLNANKNDETFEILTDYAKAVEFSQEFLRLWQTSEIA